MHFLFVLFLIVLLVGLFRRNRGDSILDTLGEGAKGCLSIIIKLLLIGILVTLLLNLYKNHHIF